MLDFEKMGYWALGSGVGHSDLKVAVGAWSWSENTFEIYSADRPDDAWTIMPFGACVRLIIFSSAPNITAPRLVNALMCFHKLIIRDAWAIERGQDPSSSHSAHDHCIICSSG